MIKRCQVQDRRLTEINEFAAASMAWWRSAQRVPLEVCPASNLRTGVYVTINSDDPPMFGTTLTDEFLLLAGEWVFDAGEIGQLVPGSVRATLLPPAERERLEGEFAAEFARLRREHIQGSGVGGQGSGVGVGE